LNITDTKVNVETKSKITSHILTQMRHNSNRLFYSKKSKESFSLQKSLREFGPKSNLDVPDENHTKGFLTESKKLNFKTGSTCHRLFPTQLYTISFISHEI
jgi:hypothetical protein